MIYSRDVEQRNICEDFDIRRGKITFVAPKCTCSNEIGILKNPDGNVSLLKLGDHGYRISRRKRWRVDNILDLPPTSMRNYYSSKRQENTKSLVVANNNEAFLLEGFLIEGFHDILVFFIEKLLEVVIFIEQ